MQQETKKTWKARVLEHSIAFRTAALEGKDTHDYADGLDCSLGDAYDYIEYLQRFVEMCKDSSDYQVHKAASQLSMWMNEKVGPLTFALEKVKSEGDKVWTSLETLKPLINPITDWGLGPGQKSNEAQDMVDSFFV